MKNSEKCEKNKKEEVENTQSNKLTTLINNNTNENLSISNSEAQINPSTSRIRSLASTENTSLVNSLDNYRNLNQVHEFVRRDESLISYIYRNTSSFLKSLFNSFLKNSYYCLFSNDFHIFSIFIYTLFVLVCRKMHDFKNLTVFDLIDSMDSKLIIILYIAISCLIWQVLLIIKQLNGINYFYPTEIKLDLKIVFFNPIFTYFSVLAMKLDDPDPIYTVVITTIIDMIFSFSNHIKSYAMELSSFMLSSTKKTINKILICSLLYLGLTMYGLLIVIPKLDNNILYSNYFAIATKLVCTIICQLTNLLQVYESNCIVNGSYILEKASYFKHQLTFCILEFIYSLIEYFYVCRIYYWVLFEKYSLGLTFDNFTRLYTLVVAFYIGHRLGNFWGFLKIIKTIKTNKRLKQPP